MKKTGGRLIVDALAAQGVERVFCIPGESYLAVLDALHDSAIQTVVCRHEGGAAMMAEAHGKLTGTPGVCMVTRGPGATNAASGVHVAQQDSTPMVLLIGQIERGMRGRDAFQEVDYTHVFGTMAKWVAEIDSPDRVPEMISRAFHVACSGRPGPVVLALPEDMLVEEAEVAAAGPAVIAEPAATPATLAAVAARLKAAKNPVVIAGGSRWTADSRAALARFVEAWDLPVACSFRRQMLVDHLHPNYAGDVGLGINPKLLERLQGADLVLLLGGRLSEVPSQSYGLLGIPSPEAALIHVHPGAEELGRVYRPEIAVNATPGAFLDGLLALDAPAAPAWAGSAAAAHEAFLAWSGASPVVPGPVQMAPIMAWLQERLGPDAIVTNGAGNYATWIHRFWRFRTFGSQLAPTSGSMGYGLPAAVAAKLAHPERPVVCFAGDGCFQMTGLEFGTAVQAGAAVVVVVVDNGMYGTIRMHQEREYPGRVSGTQLANPDFAAFARAYGGHGETVERTEDFAPAMDRALAAGVPAILHVKLDPEALTPARSLSDIRAAAVAAGR
ncbi:thiamine pyrophosphate-binding protein [Caenispirillum bisanense]|uniref:Acetolactate synthase-1/2/3 large subunit n=1 Tax=Caenispirillum bisanense TaxID=414052 RepID=A0A286G936_9PROT|nr:thiamine pyrophosphate-binding protein [Caenispirillum bisanense]SOD91716.1 acetolactate synthase-1/2/3 large subunit [Caenispirillum bisanense]